MATHRIYKEQIEDVFVLKSVYNLDMANKANIDGSNTIGGVWQVDNIFSNRFTGAKGVFNALSGNIIEWGNADLVTHRFLANSIDSVKIKVGNAEYKFWNEANFDPDDKANTSGNNATGNLASTIANSHTHSNKTVIDSITAQDLISWDDAVALMHSHLNKTVLDGITATKVTNWDNASANNHTHPNKAILDAITAAFTTADDNLLNALGGLQFESDQVNAVLRIKDGNNNVLTSISLAYLNNEGTQFVYNATNNTLDLLNDAGQILSSIPVSSFVTNLVKSANWNGSTPFRLDFKDNAGTILFSIDYAVVNIQGLQAALNLKQNNLTPGSNVQIVNNVISATDTTYTFTVGTGLGILKAGQNVEYSIAQPTMDKINNGQTAYTWGNHASAGYATRNWVNSQGFAVNPTLQTVSNNGNSTTNHLVLKGGATINGEVFYNDGTQPLGIYTAASSQGDLYIGKHSNNTWIGTIGNINYTGDLVWENAIRAKSFRVANILTSDARHYYLSPNANVYGDFTIFSTNSADTNIRYDFTIDNNGNVGIGRLNPTSKLHVQGRITAEGEGHSGQWNSVFNDALMSRGNGFVSNIDSNNILNRSEIYAVETANGTGNINFPINSDYGVFSRQQSRTFTTDWYYSNGGEAWFRTWYAASGSSTTPWRKVIDGQNITSYLANYYTQSQSLSLFVGLNGVQTISDTKTFTHSPVVPNATLNNHAVNLGQLNAVASAIPTVNNGSFVVQGVGALTGSGTTSANASANTTATLDLTAQTKADIQAGQNAGQLINGIDTWFKRIDMSGGGSVDPKGTMITVVHTANTPTAGITILDHDFDGAKLIIRAFPSVQVDCDINYSTDDGTSHSAVSLEEITEYYWDGGLGTWTLGNS